MMAQYWPLYTYYHTNTLCNNDVYVRIGRMRKALSELQLRHKEEKPEKDPALEELERIKNQEIAQLKQELQNDSERRITELSAKLDLQDQEIKRLREENSELRILLNCTSNGKPLTNGHLSDDEESVPETFPSKSSPNGKCTKVDKEKLILRVLDAEERARKSDIRADQLNVLLNKKLIELNKLQLFLSNITKEKAHLEKAQLQLRCQMAKGNQSPGSRMSPVSRISPKPRTSLKITLPT